MMVLGWGRELPPNTDGIVPRRCKHYLCPLLSQTVVRCCSPFPWLCFPRFLPSFRVSPTLCKERTAVLGSSPAPNERALPRAVSPVTPLDGSIAQWADSRLAHSRSCRPAFPNAVRAAFNLRMGHCVPGQAAPL